MDYNQSVYFARLFFFFVYLIESLYIMFVYYRNIDLAALLFKKIVGWTSLLSVLFCQLITVSPANASDSGQMVRPKSNKAVHCYIKSGTDINSDELSGEALQLAKQLNLLDKLQRLEHLRQESSAAENKLAEDQRLALIELKEEITEILEETRMEIEYVRAALAGEIAVQSELARAYAQRRDDRVFKNNLWSFRTNGVLWTLTEALSIPTYSHPRYCVTSGTIGILAGLVPSAFSLVAAWDSKRGSFIREKWPNMLAKIFGYPVDASIDYPQSVWNFLNSVPPRLNYGKTRAEILVDQWLEDKNIRILTSRDNRAQTDLLTGSVKQKLTIDLLTDRVNMMSQLDAVVALMNRPLLEVMLVVRGRKHLPPAERLE